MASSTIQFQINVVRELNKGRLTFSHGAVTVDTECWWEKHVKVDVGTYNSYATRMPSKTDGSDGGKREAIWLGKHVPYNNGTGHSDGIFIHKGTGPSWSAGCIVAAEDQIVKIWNAIHPKEQAVISVAVSNK